MEERPAKYFSGESTPDEGESTPDELDKTNKRRNEPIDHAHFEAKNIWYRPGQKPTPGPAIPNDIPSGFQWKRVVFSSGRIKYVVAAVVVVGLATLLFLDDHSSNDPRVERLADGSEVTLHGTSSVDRVALNDDVREVKLNGKAYFDIRRDESRPFTVVTPDARAEVLGTSFVVGTYNNKTEVCVESGLVALIKPGENGKNDLRVKLSKGETGIVAKAHKGILKRNISNLNYLSWKTKALEFERAKMSDVASTLEDVYGIRVVFENEHLIHCNLTAKFKERNPKDAIAVIAKTFGLSFEFEGEKVVLKGNGCQKKLPRPVKGSI